MVIVCFISKNCEAVCPHHSEICLNWPVGEALIVRASVDMRYRS